MVRSSSSSKKGEENAEVTERKRLKRLALGINILSEDPAKTFTPLSPSKQVIKHHGKDIIRKSQRKNRFLFSFPGLLAPISGGKIGELKHLGTKNPVLYLDFPQGRMKLFGTIVYPKNKYLTLQFSRGGKNVMCEDYFDNMIVFSDAWWIGRNDENPEEARLDFPKELSEEKQMDYDFQGGAGSASTNKRGVPKTATKYIEEKSPEAEFEDGLSDADKIFKDKMEVTPGRQSARIAGKKFKFAETSSEDDPVGSDADASEGEEKKVFVKLDFSTGNDTARKSSDPCPVVLDIESEDSAENQFSKQIEVLTMPATKSQKMSESAVAVSKEKSHSSRGSLAQATISTLFKKVEEKKPSSSKKRPSSKASGHKLHHNDLQRKTDQAEGSRKKLKVTKENTGTGTTSKKKRYEVEDDDIEEFSSASKDSDGSDEDWAA